MEGFWYGAPGGVNGDDSEKRGFAVRSLGKLKAFAYLITDVASNIASLTPGKDGRG